MRAQEEEKRRAAKCGPAAFCRLPFGALCDMIFQLEYLNLEELLWSAKTYWSPRRTWTASGSLRRRSAPCSPPGRHIPSPAWTPSGASRTWPTARAHGDAGRVRLHLHRRPQGGGSGDPEHLRRPGARGGPGVRQPGRPDPHEEGEPGAGHRLMRLHGPGAPGVGADQTILPPRGPGVRPPRPVEVPGAPLAGVRDPQAGVLRPGRARDDRRGHPRGAGAGREGLGLHHVRVQQLLLLLHRALRPGPGAEPGPPGGPGRGAGAGGGGVQGHHPAGPERELLRQRPGSGLPLPGPAGGHRQDPRGVPDPVHVQPPQGRHQAAL